MFPSSSSINYQNNPRANQTLVNFDDEIQYHGPNFQTYDDGHSSDHRHKSVLPYHNDNEDLVISPQILGEEDEPAMLTHQLLACNSQPRAGKKIRSNKDRHSKICTAHGLRDRRMRLSLQIARKFFDLQDLLGFDKASRTIDWLFTKSKTAIDELKGSPLSSSGNSASAGERGHEEIDVPRTAHGNNRSNNAKRKVVVLRESRDKARARARERTREKKMLERSAQSSVGALADDRKCFHGGCDRAEPNSPFQVGFPETSIFEAPTSSDHTLNPNFPLSTYDDSEKQNPSNLNLTASDFLTNSNIFTLSF